MRHCVVMGYKVVLVMRFACYYVENVVSGENAGHQLCTFSLHFSLAFPQIFCIKNIDISE